MGSFAIDATGLTKRFGAIEALVDATFAVEAGEMFGLVGPDGAGKTTLIRTLCGILPPDAGRATLLDLELVKNRNAIQQQIGYLSQRFSLYPDLTIDENIQFFAEIHEVEDYRKRRDELLEFTRLTPFRDRLADKLSGGMKQKLALAATLIHRPRLLFLDEPTTGVDPVSRREFWSILSNLLTQGITIFMATPYIDEAERCAHVGLMNHGHLLQTGTPKELRHLVHGDIIEIVTDEPRRSRDVLREVAGVEEVQEFGERLNVRMAHASEQLLRDALSKRAITVRSTRIVEPTLENVFISVLGGAEPTAPEPTATEAAHG